MTRCIFGLVSAGSLIPFILGATPITGSIGFSGGAVVDANPPTAFVSFTAPGGGTEPVVSDGSQTGAYQFIPNGTIATWTPVVFVPPTSSISPLWHLTYNSVSYDFDATSMVVNSATSKLVDIQGTGIAHITGYDDTVGTWTVRSESDGNSLNFSFTATTTDSGVPVPDGGATILLLGTAIVAMAVVGKKLRDSSPVPQLLPARRFSRAVRR